MKKIDKKDLLYTAQNAQSIANKLITIYNVVNNDPEILEDYENEELNDLRISMQDWEETTAFLTNRLTEKVNNKLTTKN